MSEDVDFGGFATPDDDDEDTYNRLFAEPVVEPAEEKTDYKALFDQQKAELETIKADLERSKQNFVRQEPAPVQNTGRGVFDGRQLTEEQIMEQLIAERGIAGAMSAMYAHARQEADQNARKNLFPVAAQTAQYAIEQYRRSADFMTDAHREEFDKLVAKFTPEQLASVDPRTITAQLQEVDDLAFGKAAKRGHNTRQNSPPLYSRGSGAGSGGSAGKGHVGRRFSSQEKAVIEMQKSLGDTSLLGDKDIADIIRQLREEEAQ